MDETSVLGESAPDVCSSGGGGGHRTALHQNAPGARTALLPSQAALGAPFRILPTVCLEPLLPSGGEGQDETWCFPFLAAPQGYG